ncbi:hypothetical protein ACIBL6_08940 [Streptomyces sp. NPDC050400]|uniref:hypothetical protein n=1 Tax=Streptomyces sp. NPDC050400 TaxID=3365610 RepID=UPI003797C3B6
MDNRLFQLGVFAVSVAGYVVLAIRGQATAEYVALVGPVLGAAFLMTHVGRQERVLTEIHANTNGVLDQRIERAVRVALHERSRGGSVNTE